MKNLKIVTLLIISIVLSANVGYAKDRNISRDLIINAPIEDVWKILGKDYANAHVWASGIAHSKALNSESLNGSSCTQRGCDVPGFGNITEHMTAYSDQDHILGYKVTDGLPSMLAFTENTWTLTKLSDGTTKVEMRLKAQTKGFMGWMMGGIMEKKMTKLIDEATEELKYFVEEGKVHPRSLKASVK